MFFEKAFFDLINPVTVSSVFLIEVAVIIIEAVIIFLLLEKAAVKAFVSSLGANLVTGILSVFYLLFSVDPSFPLSLKVILAVIAPLVFNIFIEAGVLRLFYRKVDSKRLLKVSAVMNLASYVLVVINVMPLLASSG
jgi:hypothetical protein